MKFYKALQLPFGPGASAEAMAAAFALYPGMKDMIGKMQAENVNMNGTAILTEAVIESVANPDQAAKEQQSQKQESSSISSISGIGGMLGRKMMKKKEEPPSQGQGPKNRTTVIRMNHELLKVGTSLVAADVAIPAGFKEKK